MTRPALWLILAVGLSACSSIAFKPKQSPLTDALAALPSSGVALVVDGCVQRKTAVGSPDYFGINESHALALLLQKSVRESLENHRVDLRAYAEPFICGIHGDDVDRTAYVADRFDGTIPVQKMLPVLRFPTTAVTTARGTALMVLLPDGHRKRNLQIPAAITSNRSAKSSAAAQPV